MISCDFLVLGAGEAGIMMALKLAKNGSVFLVEENEVGGSWLYSLEFPFWCWQNAVKDVSKNEPLTTETQTKVAKINDKIQKSLDHKQEEILEKIKNNPKIKRVVMIWMMIVVLILNIGLHHTIMYFIQLEKYHFVVIKVLLPLCELAPFTPAFLYNQKKCCVSVLAVKPLRFWV